ncbi:MAG: PocR ligand-binding domain-containing protein [Clostridiaceae bacterium]
MESCEIQKFDWGEVQWLHEPDDLTQRLSAGLVRFYPGKNQSSHVHFGEEQILYIVSGKGIQRLNGREEEIQSGMLIHCPPYSEHEIMNTGDKELVLLISYTPSKHLDQQKSAAVVSNRHLLEFAGPGILENIQKEVSDILKLSIVILDQKLKPVTESSNLNSFCALCREQGLCREAISSSKSGSNEMISGKAFNCCDNIMAMAVPLHLYGEIVGYLKCGHFRINRNEEFENKLTTELKEALTEIPMIPKSRLYSLQESLEVVSRLVSDIIMASINENRLNEKKVRSKITSGLKSSNINVGSLFMDREAEYPLDIEEQIRAAIWKMDHEASLRVINRLAMNCTSKSMPFYEFKELISEMVLGLTRSLYWKIEDEDTFSAIRYKYREKLKNCYDYDSGVKTLQEFAKDSITILNRIYLNGKYDLIQKMNLYIEDNYNQDMNLGFLAGLFYISPNYLSTIFNEKNGMSLKDFINKLRINKSKKYLAETDMKISEISRKVGYAQLSYYGSIFKKLEGCTPNEYRNGKCGQ